MYNPYILTWNMCGPYVMYDPLLNCLQKFGFYMEYYVKERQPGYCSWYSDLLLAGWSGVQTPLETGPKGHPPCCRMGTCSLSWGKAVGVCY